MGALSLATGDELVWSAGKAACAFMATWIVLNYLGALLGVIAEKPLEDSDPEARGDDENGNEEG